MATPEALQALADRIRQATGSEALRLVEALAQGAGNAARALTNFERWLVATGSPRLYAEELAARPQVATRLGRLLAASQPLADSLIQNPELASLILEGEEGPATREALLTEGGRLLAASSSNRHALDRLRYLKQRETLRISVADLEGAWAQPTVWRALSDLAEALVDLAAEVAWRPSAAQGRLPERPDVLVVAYGKLGGWELNYSSDIDLVYLHPDGLSEAEERERLRFAEALNRTLAEPMGRGTLYRVDLRLRPFGASGPMTRSMGSAEAYFRLYAEPWEVQALLRSRPIAGPPALATRWDRLVEERCFSNRLSEAALEQIVRMRERVEQIGGPDDLKRGRGGIRDVEFAVQALQLAHGHADPSLRVRPTLDALEALRRAGHLPTRVAQALIEGYTFLRRLEHRLQMVDHRQTHDLPTDPDAREDLAHIAGYRDWQALAADVARHRRTIETLYRRTLDLPSGPGDARETVRLQLGALGAEGLAWFDALPEAEAFYEGLAQNEGSLGRVMRLLTGARALVPALRERVALTEMVLSGEIEEDLEPAARVAALPADAPEAQVASALAAAWTLSLTRWALEAGPALAESLTALADAYLNWAVGRRGLPLSALALGSYGEATLSPRSDLDLLLLVNEGSEQAEGEAAAQDLLTLTERLHRLGSPIRIDLRLRPDGGKGLLARTYHGFLAYEGSDMELWERFALGSARLVVGQPVARQLVTESAYRLPLDADRVRDLTRMKRRIETERVRPGHVHRDLKLGAGGLSDIEWLIRLTEMAAPVETRAFEAASLAKRIGRVASAGLLNTLEREALLDGLDLLLRLRARVHLMGYDGDLLPENPDKLEALARAAGFDDGNALLARHREVALAIRQLYLDGAERLR